MNDLLRAEWQKITGNRWLVGFTLWIFPVGAVSILVLWMVVALFNEEVRTGSGMIPGEWLWTSDALGVWQFPSNLLGRMLLMGLTAVVFAGEYQWGTWKNILPGRRRSDLLLAKFIVLAGLVLFTFTLTSAIWTGGRAVLAAMGNRAYGPALDTAVLQQFLLDYATAAGLALLSLGITAVIAALLGMATRSVLVAVLVGLGISIFEPLSLAFFFLGAFITDSTIPLHGFRFTPAYNLSNIQSWLTIDAPTVLLDLPFQQFNQLPPEDPALFSALILLVWLVGGLLLTVYLFNRQDITT